MIVVLLLECLNCIMNNWCVFVDWGRKCVYLMALTNYTLTEKSKWLLFLLIIPKNNSHFSELASVKFKPCTYIDFFLLRPNNKYATSSCYTTAAWSIQYLHSHSIPTGPPNTRPAAVWPALWQVLPAWPVSVCKYIINKKCRCI